WTQARKQKLLESRLATTDAVVRLVSKSRRKPAILVQASAIGFYGNDADVSFVEGAEGRPSFTHAFCAATEKAAPPVEALAWRRAKLRIGLVLGTSGGVLARMLLPFEFGFGGPMGNGRQWMSWIHLDDIVGLILHAISVETVSGPLNGTAPEPVRNADFA